MFMKNEETIITPARTFETVVYKNLAESELVPALFAAFNRYQFVTQCWRKENGAWGLTDVPHIENWNAEQIAFLTECLQNTLRTNGIVLGAFINHSLIGFASLEEDFFGTNTRYMQLSSIHVSYEKRGHGIGTELFARMCKAAQDLGAEKLYISAHPSKETQAFYKTLGCCEALEYHPERPAVEPEDCQLEFELDHCQRR